MVKWETRAASSIVPAYANAIFFVLAKLIEISDYNSNKAAWQQHPAAGMGQNRFTTMKSGAEQISIKNLASFK